MNTKIESYHPVAKFFHWSIVISIAVQFISAQFMEGFRIDEEPGLAYVIHFSLGLLVPFLAAGLFFMRFYKPVTKLYVKEAPWIKAVTVGTHYLLYALLIVVPLSGWAAASALGTHVNFFGSTEIPLIHMNYPSFMFTVARMHEPFTTLIGLVAVAHISAALFHHFVHKDTVLKRMLPKCWMRLSK